MSQKLLLEKKNQLTELITKKVPNGPERYQKITSANQLMREIRELEREEVERRR